MIEGISHITFIVGNLDKAAIFFKHIFDADEVYSSGDNTFSLSKEKFFLVGGQWIAVMEGESLTERTYNHLAFKVAEADFDMYESRIRSLGVDFKAPRPRIEGEGRSLYFYDFDNHMFEIHTGTLEQRLLSYGMRKR